MRRSILAALHRRLWPVFGVTVLWGCTAGDLDDAASRDASDEPAVYDQFGAPPELVAVGRDQIRLAAIEFAPPPVPQVDESDLQRAEGHAGSSPSSPVLESPAKPSTLFEPNPAPRTHLSPPSPQPPAPSPSYEYTERRPLADNPRSRDMEQIAQRADAIVRRGFELASRGATFSAQAEFTRGLRTIAQALDGQHNTTRHVQALAAGLRALDESDDFVPRGVAAERSLEVAAIVSSHQTPVLKDAHDEPLTTVAALQRYYTYAQEQLAVAAGKEPVAAIALYGLGKIHATRQSQDVPHSVADGPKAIALHQAALLVDTRNYMAANELGVLLARCGDLAAARAALEHSVKIAPQPATWNNLAVVYERLGVPSAASEARRQALVAVSPASVGPRGTTTGLPQSPVVWLEPPSFAQTTRSETDAAASKPSGPASPPATQERTGATSWLPFGGKQTK